MAVKSRKIKGKVPRPKHRAGVLPTKKERDKSKALPREDKHKEDLWNN